MLGAKGVSARSVRVLDLGNCCAALSPEGAWLAAVLAVLESCSQSCFCLFFVQQDVRVNSSRLQVAACRLVIAGHCTSLLLEAALLTCNLVFTLSTREDSSQQGGSSYRPSVKLLVISFLLTLLSFAMNILGASLPGAWQSLH